MPMAKMPRPLRTVWRQVTALQRRIGSEHQKYARRADAEKQMATGFAADLRQAENGGVKPLGCIEIVGVDCRLDHGFDWWGDGRGIGPLSRNWVRFLGNSARRDGSESERNPLAATCCKG